MKRIPLRVWISLITVVLIVVIIIISRRELQRAWELLQTVDWRILLLIIPVTLISYLTQGEMTFSYLRQKGVLKGVSLLTQMRMSLELNFVNHVLPSGGVSGFSYLNWRLNNLGVSGARATMSQLVRYLAGFAGLVTLLIVAVFLVTIDGTVNRWIILMSSALVSVLIFATVFSIYLLGNKARLHRVGDGVARFVNRVVRTVTFGRVLMAIKPAAVTKFLDEIQDDFVELMKDKRILIQPYLWGVLFTAVEIAVFWIVFWALGSVVNPAPILIGYGLASLAGFAIVTPGGAGAYETVMVFVLAIAGLAQSEAIAGVVLTRIIILFVTVIVGWFFYQQVVMKYGKRPDTDLPG